MAKSPGTQPAQFYLMGEDRSQDGSWRTGWKTLDKTETDTATGDGGLEPAGETEVGEV